MHNRDIATINQTLSNQQASEHKNDGLATITFKLYTLFKLTLLYEACNNSTQYAATTNSVSFQFELRFSLFPSRKHTL